MILWSLPIHEHRIALHYLKYLQVCWLFNLHVSTSVFISVQFSHSVVCDSLQSHGLQHTRLPCPSPTPRAYSNSCPSSWWCHPNILFSVTPFSSCLQSFSASGSFLMSQFFASGGKSIGASSSILPMNIQNLNIQNWFDLPAVQGTLKSLLQHHKLKTSVLWHSAFLMVQLSHP